MIRTNDHNYDHNSQCTSVPDRQTDGRRSWQ